MASHSTTPKKPVRVRTYKGEKQFFCEPHIWWYSSYCSFCKYPMNDKPPSLERRTASDGLVEFKCKKHGRWYLAVCVTCLFEDSRSKKKLEEPKPMTRTTGEGVVQFRCKQHSIWYTIQCLQCMTKDKEYPPKPRTVEGTAIPHNEACLCSKCKPKPLDRKQAVCTCIACTETRRKERIEKAAVTGVPLGAIYGHDVTPPTWACTCVYCAARHKRQLLMLTNVGKVTITRDPRKEIKIMGEEKKSDNLTISISFPSFKSFGKWFREFIGGTIGLIALLGLIGLPVFGGLLQFHGKMTQEALNQYGGLWLMEIGPVVLWIATKLWRGVHKDPSGWNIWA